MVHIDEVEFHGGGEAFDVVARKTGRGKGGGKEAVFQFLKSILLGVDFGDIESQIRLEIGQGLRGQGQVPCGMFEDDRAHAFEVDALVKGARRSAARCSREIRAARARGFRDIGGCARVAWRFASISPAKFRSAAWACARCSRSSCQLFAHKSEKNADSYQRDFEEQVEERSSMFSAAQAHAREYARVSGHFKY